MVSDDVLKLIDSIKLEDEELENEDDDEDEERKLHGLLFELSEDQKKTIEGKPIIKDLVDQSEIIIDDSNVTYFNDKPKSFLTETFRNRFVDDYKAINPLKMDINMGVNIKEVQ